MTGLPDFSNSETAPTFPDRLFNMDDEAVL